MEVVVEGAEVERVVLEWLSPTVQCIRVGLCSEESTRAVCDTGGTACWGVAPCGCTDFILVVVVPLVVQIPP